MSLLKKDDIAFVITGKDRGKKGKVIWTSPRKGVLLVEGVNMARKHARRRKADDPQGGIISMEQPLYLSKVQYFCSRCNRPVRLGAKRSTDGSRIRFCRRCKEEI